MELSLLRKCSKYFVSAVAFFIGTEIVCKCIKYICSSLAKDDKNGVFYKAVFFPDEGILSDMASGKTVDKHLSTDQVNINQNPKLDIASKIVQNPCISTSPKKKDAIPWGEHTSRHPKTPFQLTEVGLSSVLSKSTSLIHIINVLDSAKDSLSVCLYVISATDLLNAIVNAKKRGVKVRVILDKDMSSHSNISCLMRNGIPVRYGRPSQMMHNKFAITDISENAHQINNNDLEARNFSARELEKNKSSPYFLKSNVSYQKSELPSFNKKNKDKCRRGILLTGSFNWTWSAIVSNYENVIITNDSNLVSVYSKEFEKLWTLFSFSQSEK